MKFSSIFVFLAAAAGGLAQPALTIYNQDFAVVRESLPVDLRAGVNDVRFAGATALLEPDSVVLRDPAGRVSLQILEQGYRSDAVSAGLLLSLSEGKILDFLSRDANGNERVVRGEVVRSGYLPGGGAEAPIIKVDGHLRFSLPGEPLFPALADDTILKPTLSWKLESGEPARFTAELGYVTGGFSWSASYNLVAPEKGDRLDIIGWVTVSNHSGKTFQDAAVKLMAGDVAKIQNLGANKVLQLDAFEARSAMSSPAPVVTEKAFDEFHLYSLSHPLTLHDGETKQVEFMSGTSVLAPVLYVYDGGSYRAGRGMNYGNQGNKKVWVMREFKDSEENHLGMPLPAGRLRLYRRDDSDGRLEFVGEDSIEHTPKNETVRFYTGDSFDLLGERTQTASSNGGVLSSVSRRDRRQTVESFEIKLRNHKTEPVEIRVVEHLRAGGAWEITDQSAEFTKTDANTIEFRVTVQPEVEQAVTYTAHYTWP